MLTAIDGRGQGGNEVDKFRIKIWDRVTGGKIYDNQHGDSDEKAPTTELGGGQIVIHKNGNNLTGAPSGAVANGTLLTQPMLDAAVAEAAAGGGPRESVNNAWLPCRVSISRSRSLLARHLEWLPARPIKSGWMSTVPAWVGRRMSRQAVITWFRRSATR